MAEGLRTTDLNPSPIFVWMESLALPYESEAQRGYFNEHRDELESKGVDVDEWNRASKGQKGLPAHVKKDGTESMTKAAPKKEEGKGGGEHKPAKKENKGLHLSAMHIRPLHDKTFGIEHRHKDAKGIPHHESHEYSAATLKDLHDHIDEHLGGGAAGGQGEGEEGEEEAAPAAGGAPPQGAPAAAAPAAGEEEEE